MAQGSQARGPYNPFRLLAGQTIHVTHAFQDGAIPVSVGDIINIIMDRPPVGVDPDVRKSFHPLYSHEQGVGLIGWQFTQHGITYTCRYKDNDNTDTCFFVAEIPMDLRSIYHGDVLSIAGKAHALSVIMTLLPDNQKRDTLDHISRLAAGCLDKTIGNIITLPNREDPILYFVSAKKSLILPPDERATDLVTQAYVMFDWWDKDYHYVIDASNAYPQFTKYLRGFGNAYPMLMNDIESKKALHYVCRYLERASLSIFEECRPVLFRLAKNMNIEDLFSPSGP